jgi:hypothetical protein
MRGRVKEPRRAWQAVRKSEVGTRVSGFPLPTSLPTSLRPAGGAWSALNPVRAKQVRRPVGKRKRVDSRAPDPSIVLTRWELANKEFC